MTPEGSTTAGVVSLPREKPASYRGIAPADETHPYPPAKEFHQPGYALARDGGLARFFPRHDIKHLGQFPRTSDFRSLQFKFCLGPRSLHTQQRQ